MSSSAPPPAVPSFIAIEGIDGSGKSTATVGFAELLRGRGHTVATYDFPDYDEPQFGPLIARFLRGELGDLGAAEPWFVGMLFAGNRAERAGDIRRDLAAGRTVVCDRYSYSNVAYQTAKTGDPGARAALAGWLEHLEFETFGVPRPDVSFWLHVPLALRPGVHGERGERGYLNGQADIHESSESLQERVHEAYQELAARHEDIHAIDCAPDGRLLAPAAVAELLLAQVSRSAACPGARPPGAT